VHSVEMQIRADSKGQVALDDITLRTVVQSVTEIIISRFHLIVHYVSGVNFSQGIVLCDTHYILA